MFEYEMNAQVLSKTRTSRIQLLLYRYHNFTIRCVFSMNKEHPLSMLEEKSKFISYVSRA